MLNNITWASYVYTISILLLLYYVSVGIVYYRADLQQYLNKLKRPLPSAKENHERDYDQEELNFEDDQENAKRDTQFLSDELKSLFKEAEVRNFPREEILQAIKYFLQQHVAEGALAGKAEINQFIIEGCKKYCSIHLSEEDVKVVWMK